ncbi:MAG: type I restriction-modification system subunit M N-terminal domain-containing protein, partial [Chloroflexota bacterium]
MPKPKTKSKPTPTVAKAAPPPNSKNWGEAGKGQNSKASLSSLIKSSRDIMRKDAGLSGDLDRLPQLSWILFLKCYDDLEIVREQDAIATRQKYKPIIPSPYRWRDWASDENAGKTGEEFIKFVNDGLLPALRGLTGSDERLKVAEV